MALPRGPRRWRGIVVVGGWARKHLRVDAFASRLTHPLGLRSAQSVSLASRRLGSQSGVHDLLHFGS
jgi:hypothetical protein